MTTTVDTRSIAVPGATITYDVHAAGGDRTPLFIFGSPMEAEAFGTLRGHFTDRTVVTYDPRGAGRSAVDDPTIEIDPGQHAADLQAVLAAADLGEVDVFATSGGAVNALAWIAAYRPDVRVLVAHEPPASQFVEDCEVIDAVVADIYDTYQKLGEGHAMAKFIALVSLQGPLPDDYLAGPAPDPAMFGMSADDDGSRANPLLGLNMRTCTPFRHDLAALAAAETRIVVATGAGSGEQFAARGARALAAAGDFEHMSVPGDHGGFLGGEYGQTGEPDAFAEALHRILDS
ncbi:alpha/beta hydrolase [Gordonia sp. PKS22-38]|uniref:Alpha/beta hydrolase n=1 Tax=Gordonia prachuapensis TaxID=3115651 RepID=A0ABU7MWF2_9ACTN|nr:alpha/beta hydrolase [Gordonia sp. PKS22-38]